jgi:CheY-like chemotaxis protein
MVANGAEALTILRDNSVAVFFLELTMPGIEGIEAIGVLQVIQKLKLD